MALEWQIEKYLQECLRVRGVEPIQREQQLRPMLSRFEHVSSQQLDTALHALYPGDAPTINFIEPDTGRVFFETPTGYRNCVRMEDLGYRLVDGTYRRNRLPSVTNSLHSQ